MDSGQIDPISTQRWTTSNLTSFVELNLGYEAKNLGKTPRKCHNISEFFHPTTQFKEMTEDVALEVLFLPPFYVCADRYIICAFFFLRKCGKSTIICAFKLRGF